VSCGKVCEQGLPKVKLEQEGEESWEESAKKVAEGSDAIRTYVARVGLKLDVAGLRRACWRQRGYSENETDEVCRWSELEMMASMENAAVLNSRVDPSPVREHFSTCCS